MALFSQRIGHSIIFQKNRFRIISPLSPQEKNPIADQDEFWYVDKDPNRERTRSSGNLFDDERYYERQVAKSVRPRNSASMGNILDVTRQSSLEYAPLPPPREPKGKANPTPPPLPLKPQSIYANVSSSGTTTKCKLRSSYHYERHPLVRNYSHFVQYQ